mmetsp:Transcript_84474/g.220627  ORF Transcript_84474/g.220627 Transcript_84474/m.220627 type:complete len:225 (-) Transcript_84474:1009-1683(-)
MDGPSHEEEGEAFRCNVLAVRHQYSCRIRVRLPNHGISGPQRGSRRIGLEGGDRQDLAGGLCCEPRCWLPRGAGRFRWLNNPEGGPKGVVADPACRPGLDLFGHRAGASGLRSAAGWLRAADGRNTGLFRELPLLSPPRRSRGHDCRCFRGLDFQFWMGKRGRNLAGSEGRWQPLRLVLAHLHTLGRVQGDPASDSGQHQRHPPRGVRRSYQHAGVCVQRARGG